MMKSGICVNAFSFCEQPVEQQCRCVPGQRGSAQNCIQGIVYQQDPIRAGHQSEHGHAVLEFRRGGGS